MLNTSKMQGHFYGQTRCLWELARPVFFTPLMHSASLLSASN